MRAILAIVALVGLTASVEANGGGLFGFRARQRIVVRNNFVQPVVAVKAFHSAAFVQPVVRVRAAFVQPIYAQQFVQPVYGFSAPAQFGYSQFALPAVSGCGCASGLQFRSSILQFGY